jgi:glucose-1-phosphate adenylyltransferase
MRNPDVMDFGKEVIPQALGKKNVVSYPFEGYWSDVGSIRSYHAANMALCETNHSIRFYDESRMIFTRQESLPPAKLHNCYLQDAIVSEGSQLNQCRVYNSVLGVRSIVGARTTLKNTVVFGAEYYSREKAPLRSTAAGPVRPGIGEACYIENAILDVNACIKDGVVIANHEGVQEGEGANYYIRDGIIVIPQNATIPAGTVIGSSSRFDLASKAWQDFAAPVMPVGLAR